MGYIFEAAMYIFSGALLAWYYAAFLTPKAGKRFSMLAGYGAAYVLLRYVIEYLPAGYISEPVLAMLKTTMMAALMFCLSFVFFKQEIGKQVFLLISFFAVQDTCSFITVRAVTVISDLSWQLFSDSLLRNVTTHEQVTAYMNLTMVFNHGMIFIVYAALIYFAVRSIAKGFTYKGYTLKSADILTMTLPCLSMLAISLALRAVFFGVSGGEQILLRMPGFLFTATAIFLLLTLIASVRLFQNSIQLHIEERNTAIIKEQVKQIQNQDSGAMYAEIRGMRHDMKNHLANIALLSKSVAAGNTDAWGELEEYLGKMGKTLEALDFAYDTGNSVSDVVIQQKYLEAKCKHIRFSSDFIYPAGFGIDAYDLAVILSNALDNAVEACENVPEYERFIRLGSRVKGGVFFVEISNSYIGHVSFNDRSGLPVSRKADYAEHGLGIINIQRFAHKYFGDIDIQLSRQNGAKVFRLTVMLQGTA